MADPSSSHSLSSRRHFAEFPKRRARRVRVLRATKKKKRRPIDWPEQSPAVETNCNGAHQKKPQMSRPISRAHWAADTDLNGSQTRPFRIRSIPHAWTFLSCSTSWAWKDHQTSNYQDFPFWKKIKANLAVDSPRPHTHYGSTFKC